MLSVQKTSLQALVIVENKKGQVFIIENEQSETHIERILKRAPSKIIRVDSVRTVVNEPTLTMSQPQDDLREPFGLIPIKLE